MNVCFAPRGIVQMDNVRITFKNFSGKGDKFNREGDRNFAIVIEDPATADALIAEGWNVRIKPPREEGDDPFMYLPVKVKFNDYGPRACLITNGRKNMLDEETIGELDRIAIDNIDLDIRPYDWEVNGKTGRTAYLETIEVTQRLDRFAARWAEENDRVPF